jgi:hypothetical protein
VERHRVMVERGLKSLEDFLTAEGQRGH